MGALAVCSASQVPVTTVAVALHVAAGAAAVLGKLAWYLYTLSSGHVTAAAVGRRAVAGSSTRNKSRI